MHIYILGTKAGLLPLHAELSTTIKDKPDTDAGATIVMLNPGVSRTFQE